MPPVADGATGVPTVGAPVPLARAIEVTMVTPAELVYVTGPEPEPEPEEPTAPVTPGLPALVALAAEPTVRDAVPVGMALDYR